MIGGLLNMKGGLLAPILVLVFPFLTFIQASNSVISLLLLLMICLLPGMAILELFHFSFHSLTTRIFYAILFSILFLMTVFTVYSVFTHAIGLVAPLSSFPVKIISLIILLPAISLLLRRLADSDSKSLKPFNWMIFLPRVGALFLPIVSLICVLRLNSYSDAKSTLIFLLILLAFFFLLTVNPAISPDTNLQAWFIFGISAALVLGSTFRGDGGFWGFDINLEFASASSVLTQELWLPPETSNAYASMLSITVLPVVLSLFSNFSLTIVFKVFYALILAYIPTVLYVACVRHVSRFTAMVVTGALIIGSISFIPQMTALNRQVIGMAFFVGILLVINEQKWSTRRQKLVGLFMAIGMAVSHYATAYLASTFFAISLVVIILLFFFSARRFPVGKIVFTPAFSISLVLITIIWNGVITQSVQGVKPVIDQTFSRGLNFLPGENQSLWARWLSGSLGDGAKNSASSMEVENAIRTTSLTQNTRFGITPTQDSLNYQIELADIPSSKPFLGTKVAASYSNFLTLGRTFFQIAGFVGLLLLLRKYFTARHVLPWKKMNLGGSQSLDLFGIGIAAIIIGFIARTSGTLGPYYNPERVALQAAIVLLIPTAAILEYVLFRRKFIQIFLAVPMVFFLVALLFQATSLDGYVRGSDTARISNSQSDYSPFVIFESERRAARWFAENIPIDGVQQTDSRGFLALLQYERTSYFNSLDPVNLVKGSYIYASNSNVVGEIARTSSDPIVFPQDYIDKHYLVIYSSSRARIYH